MTGKGSQLFAFPEDDDILKGIKWSLLGHFTLFLILLFKGILLPHRLQTYVPTLKVDLVGLPDLKKNLPNLKKTQFDREITQMLKRAEQDANRIKKDEMVVKPKKQSERSIEANNKRALERLKVLEKIQRFQEEEKNLSAKQTPIKGNQISPGSSLSGEAKEASTAQYYDTLRDRLQDNWTLPPWIARQDLSAQVQIYIDAQGNLSALKFLKISGNAQFDEAVKKAIQASQPFQPPPEAIKSALLADGILMGFPL